MNMILRALKYYFAKRNTTAATTPPPDTTPTNSVNWQDYMGKWYELARYETPFEYGMDNVYTEYGMSENGEVSVTNYGTDSNGKQYVAHAVAKTDGRGQLRVSFIPLLRFLSTPYRVLFVEQNYSHALVSNENGTCLWMLSRTPDGTEEGINRLFREAERRHFNTQNLRKTSQESTDLSR